MRSMSRHSGNVGRIVQTEGAMTFTVTGLSRAGSAQIDCRSPVTALERALELVRAGFVDVLIAEGKGVPHTPDKFFRLYLM